MFRFDRKKSIALLLTVCFLFVMVLPEFAEGTGTGNSLDKARDGIVGYYSANKTTLDSWREVVALKEAGQDLSKSPWVLPDWDTLLGTDPQATDYAGVILGMLAAGQDPKDLNGTDLVAELAALQKTDGSFGTWLNHTIWAVIALDEAGGSYDTGKAMEFLISKQKTDGGFALYGDTGDPDMTGDALVALGSHKDLTGVSDAINKAIECLKKMQLSDGGFSSWGYENPESIAAVIRGLLACGVKDITSGDWQQESGNMIDALFSFQLKDGAFVHLASDTKYDATATAQSLHAVACMVNAGITYTVKTGQKHTEENAEATVRVRVEGADSSLKDATVDVTGSAMDALKAAVGEANVVAIGGFITSILGESPPTIADGSTSWMYYVIRDGAIDPACLSSGADGYTVEDGDEVIFYIGAFDSSGAGLTYLPDVKVSPSSPTAGQTITFFISALKLNDTWDGLVQISSDEAAAIGDYTVKVGDKTYTSLYGQVTIPNVPEGALNFTITNSNDKGYPDVVTYKGEINVLAAGEEGTTHPGDQQDPGGTDGKDGTTPSGDQKGTSGTDQQDLPKTGGDNLPLYLAGAALLCAGTLMVRRKQLNHIKRK